MKANQNICFPIGTILSVKKYYEQPGLNEIIGKHKSRGVNLNSVAQALLSYKLSENLSVSQGHKWINRSEVRNVFKLEEFKERTLFRDLARIGKNYEEILSNIQDVLFSRYPFEHTDINLDWTSVVLHGNKCLLGKRGYSRDHRPDKEQVTVGLSELSSPINIPIGMTIREGNVNDQIHFEDTFLQVQDRLNEGSLVVFDKGPNTKENIDLVITSKMKYLSAKKLNKSDDDKRIKPFDKSKAGLIDKEDGIYAIKYKKPSRIDYFYFSEKLCKEQLETKYRKALRKYEEAVAIQKSIDNNKGLPKRFTINNELVDIEYSYQTKLSELPKEEALKLVRKAAITGREGFFCLVSTKDLTLEEALQIYRKKDSIEKLFNSLKNEIEIKPLRVWTPNSMKGAFLIGYLAQLFISLMRYEIEEVRHISAKFIISAMKSLTLTVEYLKNGRKRYIFANFNKIVGAILSEFRPAG